MMYTKFIISDFCLASLRNLYYNLSIGNFVSIPVRRVAHGRQAGVNSYF